MELFIGILFELFLTAFVYLLVPTTVCFIRKKFTRKQITTIVVINGAIIWMVFRIINTEIYGEPGVGGAVVLWSAVAFWMLNKVCIKRVSDDYTHNGTGSQEISNEVTAHDCISKTSEEIRSTNGLDVYGNNFRVISELNDSGKLEKDVPPSNNSIVGKVKFCSK